MYLYRVVCISVYASTLSVYRELRHKIDEIAVLFLRTFTPVDTYTRDYGIVDGEHAFTQETSMKTWVNYKEIKAGRVPGPCG